MRLSGWIVFLVLIGVSPLTFGQDYTSLADGAWTTAANWQNTSGWGDNTPPVSGQGSGTITLAHNMTITGDYAQGSVVLNVAAGKTLSISGNFSLGGGGTLNVSGTLVIDGDVTLNSFLNILPGGQVIVNGSVTLNSDNYLTVGTNASGPPYADLVIHEDLISVNSGDATINGNGRVAIFGDISGDGGGTIFTVNNEGQVYVDGDFTFTGGGSAIVNNNAENPYGLYVNGTTTNSGGGSSSSANQADLPTMQATNQPFYDWVSNLANSPLPVTLLFFKIKDVNNESIELQWATATELNFEKFLVQHSVNGIDFTAIGEVSGAGVDTEIVQRYGFIHQTPVFGKNYYRLQSVDLDGSSESSGMVVADFKGHRKVTLYPNPSDGQWMNIQTNFHPQEYDHIEIVDSHGSLIGKFPVAGIDNLFEFTNRLQAGLYLANFKSQSFAQTVRFVVR